MTNLLVGDPVVAGWLVSSRSDEVFERKRSEFTMRVGSGLSADVAAFDIARDILIEEGLVGSSHSLLAVAFRLLAYVVRFEVLLSRL